MDVNGFHTYMNIGRKSSVYNIIGTGDFNGDGITDILWGNASIWYMNKDASHYYKMGGEFSENIKIADFNGDGLSDILYDFPNESKLISYPNTEELYKGIGSKNGYRAY